jgi:hypothetical protein
MMTRSMCVNWALSSLVTASARDASRDRDMETVWCSEFEHLRRMVSSSGGVVEIEHASPVGATPLKVIEDAALSEGADEVESPKSMQL